MLLVQLTKIGTRTGGIRDNETNKNRTDNNVIEIDENSEKNPIDLEELVVSQIHPHPHKKNRLTLVWKTQKAVIKIIKR